MRKIRLSDDGVDYDARRYSETMWEHSDSNPVSSRRGILLTFLHFDRMVPDRMYYKASEILRQIQQLRNALLYVCLSVKHV